jgi:hypothetical protein
LSANSLTSATALSWVTISSGAWPPRTTQMKGMAAGPPETTQSRGMAARPHEMTQSSRMAAWVREVEGARVRVKWFSMRWHPNTGVRRDIWVLAIANAAFGRRSNGFS